MMLIGSLSPLPRSPSSYILLLRSLEQFCPKTARPVHPPFTALLALLGVKSSALSLSLCAAAFWVAMRPCSAPLQSCRWLPDFRLFLHSAPGRLLFPPARLGPSMSVPSGPLCSLMIWPCLGPSVQLRLLKWASSNYSVIDSGDQSCHMTQLKATENASLRECYYIDTIYKTCMCIVLGTGLTAFNFHVILIATACPIFTHCRRC